MADHHVMLPEPTDVGFPLYFFHNLTRCIPRMSLCFRVLVNRMLEKTFHLEAFIAFHLFQTQSAIRHIRVQLKKQDARIFTLPQNNPAR